MSGASTCLRQISIRSCQAQTSSLRTRSSALPESLSRQRWTPSPRSITSSTRHFQATKTLSASSGLGTPESRLEELRDRGFSEYPRSDGNPISSLSAFRKRWSNNIPAGVTDVSEEFATVVGRISSARTAGSKLAFIDLLDHSNDERLQIVVNNGQLEGYDSSVNHVKPFSKLIQRGDVISVTGRPHCTNAGELSILATAIPRLMTPCLHQLPTTAFGDDSDLAHERHVEMLTNPSVIKRIVARSAITSAIQCFLQENDFTNVQTPILAASAGGATARSFETKATEFSNRRLALRIAPELWLKRLIIGGLQRVYELGPSFRNEGLDKTHNPEFTTCEFYATNWSLEELQTFTQRLIKQAASKVTELDSKFGKSIDFEGREPWSQIDFIPAINAALGLELPDLSSPEARQQIMEIFAQKDLTTPSTPTLPRLLDKLCSVYIEPNCDDATWIVNTPECLSPLAKSFPHPDLPYQQVAARAELFIHKKEVVNCYEEENSPVEQRRKFIEQQKHARLSSGQPGETVDDEAMKIDEDYIRALEWGLPPTGGWGCGIDRLVMLMLGREKISEVLTFGNLRMVTRHAEKLDATGSE